VLIFDPTVRRCCCWITRPARSFFAGVVLRTLKRHGKNIVFAGCNFRQQHVRGGFLAGETFPPSGSEKEIIQRLLAEIRRGPSPVDRQHGRGDAGSPRGERPSNTNDSQMSPVMMDGQGKTIPSTALPARATRAGPIVRRCRWWWSAGRPHCRWRQALMRVKFGAEAAEFGRRPKIRRAGSVELYDSALSGLPRGWSQGTRRK